MTITQLLNNSMRDENDKEIKNIDREILDSSTANSNENFDVSESEFKAILRDVKRNAHIERSSSDSQDSVDEKLENVELINVNEPRTVKFKDRPKNSKNEKSLMTRANKTATKSTRRNLSEFEYVEIAVEISQRREREARERESREERDARERKAREEREERDGHVASLIVDQKLQAIKNETLANKAKRQQKINQLNENIRAIEEANIAIKKNVRALYSSEHSDDNDENLNQQLKVDDENLNEQLSNCEENFMMLSSNNDSDSDYDENFDDELTEDLNM